MTAPAEFDLIARIRARAGTRDDVVLGIGDDAALLRVPAGRDLVVAMDTLNAGVHFPDGTAAADLGWKALAVNLSDLAAMGAAPAWCTLSLSMPQADAAWVDGFLDGFLHLARMHGVALVGGDTTRGPLSICVTVHGLVGPGRALRRDGARVGDDVWVSGTPGDAAGALALLGLGPVTAPRVRDRAAARGPVGGRAGEASHAARAHASAPYVAMPRADADTADGSTGADAELRRRLDRPEPRLALGGALAGIATAALDVSDGLLADLAHVARASGVGIEVDVDAVPASAALRARFGADDRRVLQAAGGDDYELAFTAPVALRGAVSQAAERAATSVARIGRVVAGAGVHAFDAQGGPWAPPRAGWVHFAG